MSHISDHLSDSDDLVSLHIKDQIMGYISHINDLMLLRHSNSRLCLIKMRKPIHVLAKITTVVPVIAILA